MLAHVFTDCRRFATLLRMAITIKPRRERRTALIRVYAGDRDRIEDIRRNANYKCAADVVEAMVDQTQVGKGAE